MLNNRPIRNYQKKKYNNWVNSKKSYLNIRGDKNIIPTYSNLKHDCWIDGLWAYNPITRETTNIKNCKCSEKTYQNSIPKYKN
ncbi:MAG: hypothetical protein I3273_05005 [Candidatus Moeniiplasma glomeromycotorum]|nr:hypothetical protein [Candidatus Moeniiplasma glomeromycotorum]MCE8167901.1 hypothetical protein [Candidatus Moeniiplasma glomeromycotorum]MCE8169451.1 hypothetical protein [Candidatus Moeniiplasma glomeromycotorum]